MGVILYILLCGFPPFNGGTDEEIMENVKKGVFTLDGPEWAGISVMAKSLVKKMMCFDPKERYSAAEVMEDDWMRHLHKADTI